MIKYASSKLTNDFLRYFWHIIFLSNDIEKDVLVIKVIVMYDE